MPCDNLEEYGGEGSGVQVEGTHVYLWPIHGMDGKNHHNIAIILQLKYINFKKYSMYLTHMLKFLILQMMKIILFNLPTYLGFHTQSQ